MFNDSPRCSPTTDPFSPCCSYLIPNTLSVQNMLVNETDPELTLLGGEAGDEFDITDESNQALRTAPIIIGDAFDAVGSTIFPQRALYGRILEISTGIHVKSPKLYINSNAPFSGIVCGVQVRFDWFSKCTVTNSYVLIGLWEKPFYLCASRKLSDLRQALGHSSRATKRDTVSSSNLRPEKIITDYLFSFTLF